MIATISPTLDLSSALRSARAESWIAVWVHPADPTGRPYWCGAFDGARHDDMWSDRSDDARRFASFESALSDEDLEDFIESGDIEIVCVGGAS